MSLHLRRRCAHIKRNVGQLIVNCAALHNGLYAKSFKLSRSVS